MSINNKIFASSEVPHWSIIRDLRVASDITEAGSFADISIDERNGAAIGIPASGKPSNFGIFTDNNGNLICIAQDDKPAWGQIWADELLGGKRDSWLRFNFNAHEGEGGAYEGNAYIIAGIKERFNDYAGWVEWEKMPKQIEGIALQPYSTIPELLEQIENSGKNFGKPIVCLLERNVITWDNAFDKMLPFILGAAGPFASILGLGPVWSSIAQNIASIANDGSVSVKSLASVAQTLVPAHLRTYLNPASSLFKGITTGNYRDAVSALGLTNIKQSASILSAFKSGNIGSILGNTDTKLDYDDIAGISQNMFNLEVVNSMRSALRSGAGKMKLIEEGSMTRVPVLQNYLASLSSESTIGGIIPGAAEIFKTAIHETNDFNNDMNAHKAAIQASMGYPVGIDSFDTLTKKGLTEKALTFSKNGIDSFALPLSIPVEKRSEWAQDISLDVGINTIAGSHRYTLS